MTLAQLLEALTTQRRLEYNADHLPVVLVGKEDDISVRGVEFTTDAVRLVPLLPVKVDRR